MSDNARKKSRDAAVLALAGGETIGTAAKKAGVNERTLLRWRNEESFRKRINRARAEMFSRALGCAAEGAVSGALVLRQLCLKGKSETVKLSAARSLIELGTKLRDSVELEERVQSLERRLNEKKKS